MSSEGEALLAQPAVPANLETSLAMTKFGFIPPGKRFYGSSENANPQVSPFVTGSRCRSRVLGQRGHGTGMSQAVQGGGLPHGHCGVLPAPAAFSLVKGRKKP